MQKQLEYNGYLNKCGHRVMYMTTGHRVMYTVTKFSAFHNLGIFVATNGY